MAQYGRRVLQPALTVSFRRQQMRIRAPGPVRSAGGGPPQRPKRFGERLYDWAFPAETPEEQHQRDRRRQNFDDVMGPTDKIMSYHYAGKGDNMAENNKILGEIGRYGKTEEEAWRNYCQPLKK